MIRSRLSRRTESKIRKNLYLSIIGIIIVIFLAFKFGVPFLANLSLLMSGSSDKGEVNVQKMSFIAPPVLDFFPEATSSAEITITGIATKNQVIDLYINDDLVNSTKAEDDGKFSFTETIKPGENIIKAKATTDEKESNFSNIIVTIYKSAPPSLSVKSPSDNQSFSKDQSTIEVTGITDPDVKVTVNGFWAITDNSGNFSYNLRLQNGENKIKVIASDVAGNKQESEVKVTYSP